MHYQKAGDGNRTRDMTLGRSHFTTKLRPQIGLFDRTACIILLLNCVHDNSQTEKMCKFVRKKTPQRLPREPVPLFFAYLLPVTLNFVPDNASLKVVSEMS